MDLVNAYVIAIFESRKRGFTQPDGTSDDKDRWFPSEKEDADGDGSFTYPPTPKRWRARCRTRHRCDPDEESVMTWRQVRGPRAVRGP